jgi:enoyl-CoA hydratase
MTRESCSTEHCIVERDGHALIVTLNRPEARNAFSPHMLLGMYDAWQLLRDDTDLRCAILTGAGGTFCAGADLKTMGQTATNPELQKRFSEVADLHWQALLRHNRPHKPLIAAVEGFAIAGGTEILQGTDLRVAGASARFGVAEARWSLFPLGGSTVRLRRQIAYTRAAEILLTGRQVPASEALEIGLIGHVVPDGQALDKARELAALICANGPLAVQAITRSLRELGELPEEEALARELEIGQPIFATDDAREGPRAFAEKRTPVYKGR